MPHFFIPPENITGSRFVLSGDEVRHIVRVRRSGPGDVIRLFDGTGTLYRARIETVGDGTLSGVVLDRETSAAAAVSLTLYQSVPKGDRFDWLVEKAAELGVSRVVPLITERSVVRDPSPAKVERWRRLARSACQQCRRPDLMEVSEPRSFAGGVADASAAEGLNLIPWEAEEARTLVEVWRENTPAPFSPVNVFIGPEGGFAAREVEAASAAGIVPVTMGPRILRVETAGLLASVLVLDLAGEFGRS